MLTARGIELRINDFILFFKEHKDGNVDFLIKDAIKKKRIIKYKGKDKSNFFRYFAQSIIATCKAKFSD